MVKEFTFELSGESIKKVNNELQDLRNKLVKCNDEILKTLAEYVKGRMEYYISESTGNGTYIPTGELLNSIQISAIANDMVEVFTNNEHSKFVEFGTGVVGKGGHPSASQEGWNYDEKGHGQDGWFYYVEGVRYFTKGQKAHLFVQRAWEDLNEHYMDVVLEVLRQKGGI